MSKIVDDIETEKCSRCSAIDADLRCAYDEDGEVSEVLCPECWNLRDLLDEFTSCEVAEAWWSEP
jgi:hypothetical protein